MISILISSVYGVVSIAVAAATVRLYRATRQIKTLSLDASQSIEPPTVSVCIPARNEMYALSTCLDRVLASDYPKLEVLVLDDESEDDTSLLIKSYAHAGVRFIAGSALPAGWLGKNYALDTLLRAASGRYVIFLDVDTQIDYQTIRKAVREMEITNAPLLSTIPHREDTHRASALFGSLRYFWTLLFVRENTPASSAFWVVQRQVVLDHDGLNKYRLDSYPEMSLQSSVGRGRLVDSFTLGVGFEKRWSSQIDTSVRLLKPIIGHYGLVVWVLLLLVGIVPWVLIESLMYQRWLVVATTGVTVVLSCVLLLLFYRIQWSSRRAITIIAGPFIVLQEAVALARSYYSYARGRVTWKGRDIQLHSSTEV